MAKVQETSEGFCVYRDIFNGFIIDVSKQEFSAEDEFDKKLSEAVPKWKADGIRGLWAKIPLTHSSLIPVFAKNGFDFHHAQPGYAMLCQWLPQTEKNNLPEYASHYVGVAGLVIDNEGRLLVVRERFSRDKHHPWKLPGGHTEKGEDLADTSVREVLEETGIECEFRSLVCFRHLHNFRFGCSDFYFICHLSPLGGQIKHCEQEISECRWLDVDEFLSDPTVAENNKYFVRCYRDGLQEHPTLSITPVTTYVKKIHRIIYSIKKT
ncbi:hypothetical protein ScPMuIL_005285 [Solemya velum]